MLPFQILTIFPELFTHFGEIGLVRRGLTEKLVSLSTVPLRDFAVNTHGQVDDTPYGGGSGMILRVEPAVAAIEAAKLRDPGAKVVLFTPRGKVLNQQLVRRLYQEQREKQSGFILLCSRYEGIDQRVVDHWVDIELSVGDYVLMGGEVPAMAFMESVIRLVPGVLGNPESLEHESFEHGLLEHAQYTKPSEFHGYGVPDVLMSGNHQEIARWRKEHSIQDTIARRPELLEDYSSSSSPSSGPKAEVSLALLHHPVTDKNQSLITSSITNLDLHDIARSARTYGAHRFYVAHPIKLMRKLAGKICDHWEHGYGAQYNPNRSDALETLSIVTDLDDVFLDMRERTKEMPVMVTTSARPGTKRLSFSTLRAILQTTSKPHLLVFGTGWGLAEQVLDRADYHLDPIYGPGDYNHLSVRSAVAIILDRLLSPSK